CLYLVVDVSGPPLDGNGNDLSPPGTIGLILLAVRGRSNRGRRPAPRTMRIRLKAPTAVKVAEVPLPPNGLCFRTTTGVVERKWPRLVGFTAGKEGGCGTANGTGGGTCGTCILTPHWGQLTTVPAGLLLVRNPV